MPVEIFAERKYNRLPLDRALLSKMGHGRLPHNCGKPLGQQTLRRAIHEPFVVCATLYHGRDAADGRADPPIVPIA